MVIKDVATALAAVTSQLAETKKFRHTHGLADPTPHHLSAAVSALAPLRAAVLASRSTTGGPRYDKYGFLIESHSVTPAGPDPTLACATWVDKSSPSDYASNLSLGCDKSTNPSYDAVFKDLPRTFPTNKFFLDETLPHYTALKNVLLAYSVRYPDGYCQGMNFIAAAMLLVLGADRPEDAYWILARIVEDPKFNQGYYSLDMVGIRLDQIVMNSLVETVFPDVHSKMETFGMCIGDICVRWFLTLCIDTMSFHCALQFLDGFMRNGAQYSFVFTMGLVSLLRPTIVSAVDIGEVMTAFRTTLETSPDIRYIPLEGEMMNVVGANMLREKREEAKGELARKQADRDARQVSRDASREAAKQAALLSVSSPDSGRNRLKSVMRFLSPSKKKKETE